MPTSGPPLDAPADLTDLLRRGLDDDADGCALHSRETQLTWRELHDASDRLAGRLLGLGLVPGDRIASLMPNRTALVIHYLACVRAGLVAMPLNYRYRHTDIDYALSLAKPMALLVHAERASDIAAVPGAGQLPLGVIAYGGELGSAPRLETLIEEPSSPVALPVLNRDAPVFLFFTSGTTGKPKGVVHSLETFGWMVASNAAALDLASDDVVLPGSSISHTASLRLTLAGLWSGARTDVVRSFDSDEMLWLLRRTKPSVALILPVPLSALIHDHGAGADDFGSLRLMMSGGDKPPKELEEAFAGLAGIPISGLYGMTEMGTSHTNTHNGVGKSGSVGPNNPGYTSSLRDDDGREVPTGVDGRHWVKSPTVMRGYWNNEQATDKAIRDGWFDTGDVMCVDDDGYFWFRGRRKQIIVHDGSNISPAEVEDILMSHPSVAAAGAVGVHDELHGEDVWAFVTPREDAPPPKPPDVIRFARDRIGYKAPDAIIVIDALPLTISGKVDREALKTMAAERAGASLE